MGTGQFRGGFAGRAIAETDVPRRVTALERVTASRRYRRAIGL